MWVLSLDSTGLIKCNKLYIYRYENSSYNLCNCCSEYENKYCNVLKTSIEEKCLCDYKCFSGLYCIEAISFNSSLTVGTYKTLERAKEIMQELSQNVNSNKVYIMPEE